MIVANSIDSGDAIAGRSAGAEQRISQRFKTLLRTAKLIGLTGEFVAVIRDVSDTGLKLKLFHPVPEDRMALELADGSHFFIEKVWEHGSEAGFRFSSPVDVAAFLSVLGRKDDGSVLLDVTIPGTITVGNVKIRMTINTLSRQGADLESGVLLGVGEPVLLNGGALPQLSARISEAHPSHYRVHFNNLMRLDDLAQVIWAAARKPASSDQRLRESRIRSASRLGFA